MRISNKRLARMWRELNSWKTPKELQDRNGGKMLTEDQVRPLFNFVDLLITEKEKKSAWQKYTSKESK